VPKSRWSSSETGDDASDSPNPFLCQLLPCFLESILGTSLKIGQDCLEGRRWHLVRRIGCSRNRPFGKVPKPCVHIDERLLDSSRSRLESDNATDSSSVTARGWFSVIAGISKRTSQRLAISPSSPGLGFCQATGSAATRASFSWLPVGTEETGGCPGHAVRKSSRHRARWRRRKSAQRSPAGAWIMSFRCGAIPSHQTSTTRGVGILGRRPRHRLRPLSFRLSLGRRQSLWSHHPRCGRPAMVSRRGTPWLCPRFPTSCPFWGFHHSVSGPHHIELDRQVFRFFFVFIKPASRVAKIAIRGSHLIFLRTNNGLRNLRVRP
jgi:hypothetical protein